jgi:hypothetical protein
MIRLLLIAAFVLLPATLVTAQKAPKRLPDENEETIEKFMRAKLLHSQKLLEAITVEDYDMMAKSSQEMSLLTLAETWQVLQTADFLHESTAFRRSADAMTAAAKKKNLDAAALAYVEMTMQCVKCHKMIRHAKMASTQEPVSNLAVLQRHLQPAKPPKNLATGTASIR